MALNEALPFIACGITFLQMVGEAMEDSLR